MMIGIASTRRLYTSILTHGGRQRFWQSSNRHNRFCVKPIFLRWLSLPGYNEASWAKSRHFVSFHDIFSYMSPLNRARRWVRSPFCIKHQDRPITLYRKYSRQIIVSTAPFVSSKAVSIADDISFFFVKLDKLRGRAIVGYYYIASA